MQSIAFLLGGFAFVIVGIRTLIRGKFQGGLYEVDRKRLPHRFYYTVVSEVGIGLLLLVMGLSTFFQQGSLIFCPSPRISGHPKTTIAGLAHCP